MRSLQPKTASSRRRLQTNMTSRQLGKTLFELARQAQERGWSAEDLLRAETLRHEKTWRKIEAAKATKAKQGTPHKR